LDIAIDLWDHQKRQMGPFPEPLKKRLAAVLTALKKPPIDDAKFISLRGVRNELTHPAANATGPALKLEQAETTFGFCVATIRDFFPFKVHLQF
jgi:hypothetical protein